MPLCNTHGDYLFGLLGTVRVCRRGVTSVVATGVSRYAWLDDNTPIARNAHDPFVAGGGLSVERTNDGLVFSDDRDPLPYKGMGKHGVGRDGTVVYSPYQSDRGITITTKTGEVLAEFPDEKVISTWALDKQAVCWFPGGSTVRVWDGATVRTCRLAFSTYKGRLRRLSGKLVVVYEADRSVCHDVDDASRGWVIGQTGKAYGPDVWEVDGQAYAVWSPGAGESSAQDVKLGEPQPWPTPAPEIVIPKDLRPMWRGLAYGPQSMPGNTYWGWRGDDDPRPCVESRPIAVTLPPDRLLAVYCAVDNNNAHDITLPDARSTGKPVIVYSEQASLSQVRKDRDYVGRLFGFPHSWDETPQSVVARDEKMLKALADKGYRVAAIRHNHLSVNGKLEPTRKAETIYALQPMLTALFERYPCVVFDIGFTCNRLQGIQDHPWLLNYWTALCDETPTPAALSPVPESPDEQPEPNPAPDDPAPTPDPIEETEPMKPIEEPRLSELADAVATVVREEIVSATGEETLHEHATIKREAKAEAENIAQENRAATPYEMALGAMVQLGDQSLIEFRPNDPNFRRRLFDGIRRRTNELYTVWLQPRRA